MKNYGGPAFPVNADGALIPDCDDWRIPPQRQIPGHPGMSLRDWFAGQALAQTPRDGQPSERAAWAYALADAMLAVAPTPPPAQVTDEMVDRFALAYEDACIHRYDTTAIRFALKAALQPEQSK